MNDERTPTDPFIYPTRDEIETIHSVIIRQRGVNGYGSSKGMVDACIEFARTDTHMFVPFPNLEIRASAIIYSFISFHPYADGNKRTSLLVTSYFLFMNGYNFNIPDDAPEFTKSLAERVLDGTEHTVKEEVERVRDWLVPQISQGPILRLFHHLTYNRKISSFAQFIWVIGFIFWNEIAQTRLKELNR